MDVEQIRQMLFTALDILADYWYVPAIIISLHLVYMLLMDILGMFQPPLPKIRQLKKQLGEAGFVVEQVSGESGGRLLIASTESCSALVMLNGSITQEDIQEAVVLQQTHCCQLAVVVARELTDEARSTAADAEMLLWSPSDWQQKLVELVEKVGSEEAV